MKSIQTKMILLILIGIIISSTLIGGTGILSSNEVIDADSAQIMILTCREKAQELNSVLMRIEQSVEILAKYSTDNLTSVDKLSDNAAYMNAYVKKLEELAVTVANETEGAVAVYGRINPDFSNPLAGFFKVKNQESKQFEDTEITDISKYSPDDMEHVGWYYVPVNAGKAVWMKPYYNKNIDVYMISYEIPVYKDNELLGVVGMDIDFNYLTDKVDEIKIYDTGSAFLTDKKLQTIHSKENQDGALAQKYSTDLNDRTLKNIIRLNKLYDYTLNGIARKVTFSTLENGMCLAVTAPVSEIDSAKNMLVWKTLLIAATIMAIFVLITLAIAKTIIKPLKELSKAAVEIADGNLNASLTCHSKDEVGSLSFSMQKMVAELKERMEYVNKLAYLDTLTSMKNRTAYSQELMSLESEMNNSDCSFAVFVIDVNGLKYINDTYGHDYGNKLLIAASKAITGTFGYENSYRIGGDEFAVILKDKTVEQCMEFEKQFKNSLQNYGDEIRISAAIGSAVYDKNIDHTYDELFKRADSAMYKQKQSMKSCGETSDVILWNK